jgi:hypothetical protein
VFVALRKCAAAGARASEVARRVDEGSAPILAKAPGH